MKRKALTLLLLFAASVFLLSACSRREAQGGNDTSKPGVASATASPSATGQSQNQPSTQPSALNQPSSQPSASNQPSSQLSASSQATKSGWWIRINPVLTTAEVITFQIGTDKFHREEWRVWRKGESAEFDVPEKYLQLPRLYVRGNVTPIGKLATLCMMYKTRGVEHMSFDDDDAETKGQTEVDLKCR